MKAEGAGQSPELGQDSAEMRGKSQEWFDTRTPCRDLCRIHDMEEYSILWMVECHYHIIYYNLPVQYCVIATFNCYFNENQIFHCSNIFFSMLICRLLLCHMCKSFCANRNILVIMTSVSLM